jgi:hypothetical protein
MGRYEKNVRNNMPPGDAQRVWFPEMIDELKARWSSSMTWEEFAAFCQRMNDMRKQIRQSRGIKPPLIKCRKCGEISRSDIKGVSIRSGLFALKKYGIITETELKNLNRDWSRYQRKNRLNAYGYKKNS